MDQRRARDPKEVPADLLLLPDPRGELLIVDRPLATHLGRHELELCLPAPTAQEAGGVHEHPIAPILGVPHDDLVPLGEAARFADLEPAGATTDDDTVHPGTVRHDPCSSQPDVGREVGGAEEVLGEDPVGGEGGETGLGRCPEGGRREVGTTIGVAHRGET